MSQQVKIKRRLDLWSSAAVKGVQVIEKTAAYTLTPADSGKLIVANHASTQVEFTTPSVTDSNGCVWFLTSLGAAGMKILGPSGKLCVLNNAAATNCSYETANLKIGCATIVCGDGVLVYVLPCSSATRTLS